MLVFLQNLVFWSTGELKKTTKDTNNSSPATEKSISRFQIQKCVVGKNWETIITFINLEDISKLFCDSLKQNTSSQQAFLDSIHAEPKITQFVGTCFSVSFSSQTFIEEWFRYLGLQGSGSRQKVSKKVPKIKPDAHETFHFAIHICKSSQNMTKIGLLP